MSGDGRSDASTEKTPVTVIDAGVGNLGNLRRALESVGATVEVTTDPDVIRRGGVLVLPGVGAFKPPREAIRGALEDALRKAVDGGAYLLGICVGFQLLFESSSEFGETDGLGLLPGRVDRLPSTVRLPQIGWNALVDRADHPLLNGLGDDPY
ncbi:MAG: imidazole glycerol phosphate synthase subunit HisH, partial [Acidobacteriota bacterium]